MLRPHEPGAQAALGAGVIGPPTLTKIMQRARAASRRPPRPGSIAPSAESLRSLLPSLGDLQRSPNMFPPVRAIQVLTNRPGRLYPAPASAGCPCRSRVEEASEHDLRRPHPHPDRRRWRQSREVPAHLVDPGAANGRQEHHEPWAGNGRTVFCCLPAGSPEPRDRRRDDVAADPRLFRFTGRTPSRPGSPALTWSHR